jgi:hypothetical protein
MKTGSKSRKLFALITSLLGVGIIVLIWAFGPREQQLTLSDGTVIKLRKVSFGTNHVFGSPWALLINRLPDGLRERLVEFAPDSLSVDSFETGPALFLWLEGKLGSNVEVQGMHLMLAPADARPAVYSGSFFVFPVGHPRFEPLGYEYFNLWPRRAEEIDIVVFNGSDMAPENLREVGRFRVRNSERYPVPPWKAEELPVTRQSGDLEVKLKEFVSGISYPEDFGERGDEQYFSRYKVGIPAIEPAVFVALEAKTVGRTSEDWTVERVELSDPTGNRIDGRIFYRTEKTLAIASALWPDEPAWKLTMDLKRETGHEPDDLLVFTNVHIPEVGGTSTLNWTNSANGVAVKLEWFKHKPVITDGPWRDRGYSWARLAHKRLPPDLVLDFVSATVDDGTALRLVTDDHSAESYRVAFKDLPPNASKLNLTFAVQKLRRVEFLVSPNWLTGTNSFEYVEPAPRR